MHGLWVRAVLAIRSHLSQPQDSRWDRLHLLYRVHGARLLHRLVLLPVYLRRQRLVQHVHRSRVYQGQKLPTLLCHRV